MKRRIQVAEARKDLAAVVARSAGGDRIKITRYGKTIAALVPKRDLEKLEECEDKEQVANARR